MEDQYTTQMSGDKWWIAGGIGEDMLIECADTITLWNYDYPEVTVTYSAPDKHTRGTYAITAHEIPEDRFTADDLTGWRDWRDAIEFASGTNRDEWNA